MSDYLAVIAAGNFNPQPDIEPRLPTRFEAWSPAKGAETLSQGTDLEVAAQIDALETANTASPATILPAFNLAQPLNNPAAHAPPKMALDELAVNRRAAKTPSHAEREDRILSEINEPALPALNESDLLEYTGRRKQAPTSESAPQSATDNSPSSQSSPERETIIRQITVERPIEQPQASNLGETGAKPELLPPQPTAPSIIPERIARRRPSRPEQTYQASVASTINVSIGRVEVRAVSPSTVKQKPSRRASPVMSLEEYLRQRSGEAV